MIQNFGEDGLSLEWFGSTQLSEIWWLFVVLPHGCACFLFVLIFYFCSATFSPKGRGSGRTAALRQLAVAYIHFPPHSHPRPVSPVATHRQPYRLSGASPFPFPIAAARVFTSIHTVHCEHLAPLSPEEEYPPLVLGTSCAITSVNTLGRSL